MCTRILLNVTDMLLKSQFWNCVCVCVGRWGGNWNAKNVSFNHKEDFKITDVCRPSRAESILPLGILYPLSPGPLRFLRMWSECKFISQPNSHSREPVTNQTIAHLDKTRKLKAVSHRSYFVILRASGICVNQYELYINTVTTITNCKMNTSLRVPIIIYLYNYLMYSSFKTIHLAHMYLRWSMDSSPSQQDTLHSGSDIWSAWNHCTCRK